MIIIGSFSIAMRARITLIWIQNYLYSKKRKQISHRLITPAKLQQWILPVRPWPAKLSFRSIPEMKHFVKLIWNQIRWDFHNYCLNVWSKYFVVSTACSPRKYVIDHLVFVLISYISRFMRGNFTDAAIIISCNTHEKIFNDLSCYSSNI